MSLKYDEKVREWIKENRDEIIEKWMELCRIPSVWSRPSEDAPFGKECARALSKCAEIMTDCGFPAKLCARDGYMLSELGDGDKTIGIFSHCDVVPVGDGWIFTKPFEPILKEGFLIGRGVEDDKSGFIAGLCAMSIFRDLGIPLKNKIQLFVGSNEESGMEDIKEFREKEKMPEISFVPDADFPCSTGEKGICHLYAQSSDAFCDIIDFYGGEAFNIILDKAMVKIKNNSCLAEEIKTKLKNNQSITIEEDDSFIVLVGKGIAKHASIPEGSLSAAYVLASFLKDLEELSFADREIMRKASHILSCPFGTSLGIDYCDDLFGRLTFANGIAKTENNQLKLSFDMRYSSKLDGDDLINRTKTALSELCWDTTIKSNEPGFCIDEESPYPSIFENIYEEITTNPLKSVRLGGGTYARKLENAFSIGVWAASPVKEDPLFDVPQGHGGPHQCDEMINVDEFFASVRILVQYILAVDQEL